MNNDEIKPSFIRHYCYDCDSEVANYAEHNADHAISNMPYYSQKQLASACANTSNKIFSEIDKMISYYTVSGEYSASGSIAHIQRSRYESLKEQHKVPR